MRLTVNKLDVTQMGKVTAAIYGVMALLMLPFMALGALSDAEAVLPMVFMLLLYPVMGFIGGVIMAFVYNIVAQKIGGIAMEVDQEAL